MEKKEKSKKLQINIINSYIGKIKDIYNAFDEEKHLTLLATYQGNVTKKLEKAEDLHEEILDLIDDEGQMMDVEEEFSAFKINAENELLILKQFLAKFNPTADHVSVTSTTGRNMKLPKLTIKPFDGNPLNWKTFQDTFLCTIDNNMDLSDVEKMSYLLNLVQGDAEQTLKGFALTNDSYKIALEIERIFINFSYD